MSGGAPPSPRSFLPVRRPSSYQARTKTYFTSNTVPPSVRMPMHISADDFCELTSTTDGYPDHTLVRLGVDLGSVSGDLPAQHCQRVATSCRRCDSASSVDSADGGRRGAADRRCGLPFANAHCAGSAATRSRRLCSRTTPTCRAVRHGVRRIHSCVRRHDGRH